MAIETASENDYAPIITGIPLPQEVSLITQLVKDGETTTHPIRQNPSRKLASAVTSYGRPGGQHIMHVSYS
jgi:hypothetical protein